MKRIRLGVPALPSGPATASTLGALGVVFLAAAVPPTLIAGDFSVGNTASNALIAASYGGVGLVVARRQPRNVVGWIMLCFGVLLTVSTAAGGYAALIYHFGHRGLPLGSAAVLLDLLWSVAIGLIPLAVLLFPDGTLPSPRWRWVLRAYPVIAAWLTPAQELILPMLVVFWVVFVGRQAASFRRASHERRQQLKWLMSGAAACLVGAAIVTLGGSLDTHPSRLAVAATGVASVVTIAFPLSIGVGILKYRLYDIDRIISRTLGYAIITGLLIGVYASLVLLVTEVLAFTTPVAVAVATLTAAALFSPLRRRVQHAVDRRFNRACYDADQAIAAFAARLKDAVDLDAVRADLLESVQQALEPAHASVWINRVWINSGN